MKSIDMIKEFYASVTCPKSKEWLIKLSGAITDDMNEVNNVTANLAKQYKRGIKQMTALVIENKNLKEENLALKAPLLAVGFTKEEIETLTEKV